MNENSATSQTRKYGMVGSAIRWLAISVGGLAGALVLIALVVMIFGIPIELNGVKGKIEPVASEADLARLDRTRVELRLLPLLKGEVLIEEIAVEGLHVDLETNAHGEPNWVLPKSERAAESETVEEAGSPALKFIELAQLSLRGEGLALDFDLTGPKLKDLEAILDTTLPPIQSFGLKGRLQEAEGRYRIVDLTGEIATTGVTGKFEAGTSGAKLRLRKFCEQACSRTAVIPSSYAFG